MSLPVQFALAVVVVQLVLSIASPVLPEWWRLLITPVDLDGER